MPLANPSATTDYRPGLIEHSIFVFLVVTMGAGTVSLGQVTEAIPPNQGTPVLTHASLSANAPHLDIPRFPQASGVTTRSDISPPLLQIAITADAIAPEDLIERGPKKVVANKFVLPELVARAGTPFNQDALRIQDTTAATRGGGVQLLASVPGYTNLDNIAFGGQVAPSDAVGDVGANYYIQYANNGFLIFDKSNLGNPSGPFIGNSFWNGFGGPCELNNAGDPIVLYDHLAQRWVFSQFTGDTEPRQCFAVSTTSDPFGQYRRFEFNYSNNNTVFNDYGKIGLWTDETGKRSGYYMTSNDFVGEQFNKMSTLVFERDKMLSGSGSPGFVSWDWPVSKQAVFFGGQPPHLEGNIVPPANACAFFSIQWDDEASTTAPNPNTDGYVFWEVCVDWNAQTFFASDPYFVSANLEFDAAFCSAGSCMPQPGTTQKLDTLSQFTMYRASIRGIQTGGGNEFKMVLTHTSNAGADRAGIHWTLFDLDSALASPGSPAGNPGPLPQIEQSSTFAPGSAHRAFGTAAIDRSGNIGMALSATATNLFPSVLITGRETSDPVNQLQGEQACVVGGGSQTGANRWHDYATTSVDPVDGCTFWSTTTYMPQTSSLGWATRVCAFSFPSCGGSSGGGAIFADGFESGNTSQWN